MKKDPAPGSMRGNNKGESCFRRPHSGLWLSVRIDSGFSEKIVILQYFSENFPPEVFSDVLPDPF